MLKTENLTKVFLTDEVETTALNRVDFAVKPGESVAITPFADFKGDPATANWLPNEALAKAWKAKMGF